MVMAKGIARGMTRGTLFLSALGLCAPALFNGSGLGGAGFAEGNGPAFEPHPEVAQHLEAEFGARSQSQKLAALAFGPKVRTKTERHPWPFDLLSIGHSMASYQNYGGSPYFHHGLDIRGDAGTDVLASTGGRVVNIENYMPGSAYWEVAILDAEGYVWQYHHVDRRSIPQAIWDAYRSGDEVPAGTKVGEIYYWGTTAFGERYHHVHLNILGEGGFYMNPFAFLTPLDDQAGPEIVEIGVLKDGRKFSGRAVTGRYTLFAKIHDLVLHDRFVLPPYKITYRIDGGAEEEVWTFDGLPGGDSNTRYVTDFFARNLSCGNYDCRNLTVDLGFSTDGPRWFTTDSGEHEIEVIASDFVGNTETRTFRWSVD